MKIAILGAGKVGGALGKKWSNAGHTIRFGVRDTHKPQVQELVQSLGANVSATNIAEAIDFGDVVLFAITGTPMDEMIIANAQALDGKIIIDAANKFNVLPMNSLATFAAQAPTAPAYRAFNCYGWENFENPLFGGVVGDLFYCGPDTEPRLVIERLISDVGLNPVYIGGPEQAELCDALVRLWFALAVGQNMSRNLTLKVLRR